MRFPDWTDAPSTLIQLDGNCGPLAAWALLRHLRVRTSSKALIRSLRFSRKWGVFTIGIAVAFAEHGLDVEFYTDPDPDIQALERRLYARARRLGIAVRPAVGIRELTAAVRDGRRPVVFYRVAEGAGHFSPVVGFADGKIELPNDAEGGLSIGRFRRAWCGPDFPRQTVIARRPPNGRLHPFQSSATETERGAGRCRGSAAVALESG